LHLLEQKLSYSGGGPSEVRDKLSHMEAMLQNLTKKIEKHEETMTRMENELRETQRGHTELFASNRAIESQVNKLTLSKEIADAVNLTQIRQNPSSSIVVQTNPSADPRAAGTATGAAHHEVRKV
jgi:septal ring factor EnvC (AmiA/AmiB activator)